MLLHSPAFSQPNGSGRVAFGLDRALFEAVMPRVRGNLAYLHNREKVNKSGTGASVRWSLS